MTAKEYMEMPRMLNERLMELDMMILKEEGAPPVSSVHIEPLCVQRKKRKDIVGESAEKLIDLKDERAKVYVAYVNTFMDIMSKLDEMDSVNDGELFEQAVVLRDYSLFGFSYEEVGERLMYMRPKSGVMRIYNRGLDSFKKIFGDSFEVIA